MSSLKNFDAHKCVYLLRGLRCEEHQHAASLQLCRLFDHRKFRTGLGKPFHGGKSDLRMSHLTAAETDGDLDLVALSDEPLRMVDLRC